MQVMAEMHRTCTGGCRVAMTRAMVTSRHSASAAMRATVNRELALRRVLGFRRKDSRALYSGDRSSPAAAVGTCRGAYGAMRHTVYSGKQRSGLPQDCYAAHTATSRVSVLGGSAAQPACAQLLLKLAFRSWPCKQVPGWGCTAASCKLGACGGPTGQQQRTTEALALQQHLQILGRQAAVARVEGPQTGLHSSSNTVRSSARKQHVQVSLVPSRWRRQARQSSACPQDQRKTKSASQGCLPPKITRMQCGNLISTSAVCWAPVTLLPHMATTRGTMITSNRKACCCSQAAQHLRTGSRPNSCCPQVTPCRSLFGAHLCTLAVHEDGQEHHDHAKQKED